MIFGKDKKSRPSGNAHDFYLEGLQALTADMKGAALMFFARAVQADPGNPDYVQAFAGSVKGMAIKVFDTDLKQAVTIALDSPHCEPQGFADMWYRLLVLDPDFSAMMALATHESYEAFRQGFAALAPKQGFADPLFLAGFRRLILPSIVLERFLTHLRRTLLISEKKYPAALAAALGAYCFYTGYIFDSNEDEQKQVAILHEKIVQTADLASSAEDIALLACYMPLAGHPRAREILAAFNDDAALGLLVREAIEEPLTETAIATSIPRLTAVDDETSRDVQCQYIAFPYPRWRYTEKDKKLSSYFGPLKDEALDILIAGCGTGQEVMYYSAAFPKARILAVDLSPVSLSYALRKARERGVTNVDFRQADILALPGALDRQFDIVISSGVLHHMKEPEKGFAVVHGLTKPDGLMRISLYSALARRHIINAHKIIADHNFGNSADEMRRFRREAPALLAPEDLAGIMRARDYFIMPQCRDLLFHVMEHQFDIPRIARLLEKFSCEFLEFVLPDDVLARYRASFPEDPQATDIRQWATFETTHPDTFAAMYRFVARKL